MPKFIKDVNKLHKMWSVRAAVSSVLLSIQEVVPFWEGIVPDNVFLVLGALASTGVIIGRAIDQKL
jgi:hypothetical protein